jgi:hypothetical protein
MNKVVNKPRHKEHILLEFLCGELFSRERQ